MSLAPMGGGGYAPSPYEVGAADFAQAQKDIEKLNSLKVTKSDYKDATDEGILHSWFGNKDDKQKLIKQLTQLEDDASKHLQNISAANMRGQVSSGLLAQAQGLANTLSNRADQESANSLLNDISHSGSVSLDAYERAINVDAVRTGLEKGTQPDAISLQGTAAFMDQVKQLDAKIKSDHDKFQFGATQADKDAAKAQLAGPDEKQLSALFDKVNAQTGGLVGEGVVGPKLDALPDGDPQKEAYIKQCKDLNNLLRHGGTLSIDNDLLDSVLNPPASA